MRWWLVVPGFVIGCGGIESYDVPPAQGRWDFSVLEKTTDECAAIEGRADLPLPAEIASVWVTPSEDGFTIAVNGGDDAPCAMEGGAFTCVASVERLRLADELMLSTALLASGWLEGGNVMDGEFTLDYACRGADCADFEASYEIDAPCRTAGTFVAQPERLQF